MFTKASKTGLVLLLTLDFVALVLLSMSGAMFLDFTHRLLSANPDALGIVAIGTQAALAVVASSTFTKRGSALLRSIFGNDGHHKSLWRLLFAAALFVCVALSWMRLPGYLADRYNTRGYNLNHSIDTYRNGTQDYKNTAARIAPNPQTERAEVLESYQRAVSLDPASTLYHFDEGVMLEGFYRYDEAEEQFRQAILTERADAIDLKPFAALAQLQLQKGKPLDALQIVADAQLLKPAFDAGASPSLYKTKAKAEYALGYYQATVADAERSKSAAGTCVAAKAYEKLRQTKEAGIAWATFQAQYRKITPDDLVVDPDCPILSAEFSHANP